MDEPKRVPQDGDMKQSELCQELGLSPFEMKEIRAEHLASQDWFTYGRGGQVWLTLEGQRKLRIWMEAKDDVAQVAHHFIDAYVLNPLPHPQWIRAKIRNGNGEWISINCLVPRNIKRMMIRGKKIRVEVVQSINGTGYRHELLADYPVV